MYDTEAGAIVMHIGTIFEKYTPIYINK